MPTPRLLPLLAALLWGVAGPATAAFHAHRLSAAETVKMDGVPDDPAWQQARVHDTFYETRPREKIAASVRTEVRLAYDADNLYVAIRAHDPRPELIRAPFIRRDKIRSDQDFIGLFIDPSGTNQSAQIVYLNPRGAFTDGTFVNGQGEDTAPDFDVQVVTARFDGGWTAEVRIPFASISYATGTAPAWDLLVMRNMTREQRYQMFSGQVTRSSNCLLCFSEPVEGLADLPSQSNWTATPQLMVGKRRERTDGQPQQTSSNIDLALDVKVRPDSATVIDATITPDFSPVELDAPQLSGNTRFGLFVPEKRPFFLEGSDILQTPMRAISTRSMTDPQWGARYTRRDAGRDLTLLTVRDAGGGVVMLPKAYQTDFAVQDFTSQATVARASFRSEKASFGALVSDRTLGGGRGYNRVLGADFGWQGSNSEKLSGQVLGSATTAQPDASGSLQEGERTDGAAAQLMYDKEGEKYGVWGMLEYVDPDFRNDNGFFSQAGTRAWGVEVVRHFGKAGVMNELDFYVHAERTFDSKGNAIENDYTPGVKMRGPYDLLVDLRVRTGNALRVREDGELFKLRTIWALVNAAPGRVVASVTAKLELGDQVDVEASRLGKGGNVMLYGRIRPHDRIEIEPTYNANWVNGVGGAEDGKRLYTEQALQLNAIYHFGPLDTVRAILQKTRTSRDPSLYALPVAARSSGSTASFVYGHTARLGTAAYIGLTLTDGETPGFSARRREDEVFVKLSWQI